jgi:hypothetical protein
MKITADWIWRKHPQSVYNDIIIAERRFDLPKEIQKAVILVTADSFYRLYVNGTWIGDGPARGWPEHYYYDSIEITKNLRPGQNEIRIIACYHGAGHFQGIPKRPGLLAQMDVCFIDNSSHRIVTDESWQIAPASGWISNTPKISCQMPPAEYYDARNQESLCFDNAIIVAKTHEGPWKDLRPRNVQRLTLKPVQAERLIGVNLLKKADRVHTYCLPWAKLLYPGLIQANCRLMPAFALVVGIELEEPVSFSFEVTDYRKGIYKTYIDGQRFMKQTSLETGRHWLFLTHGLSFNHTSDICFNLSASGLFRLVNLYHPHSENPWTLLSFEEFRRAETDFAYKNDSTEFLACKEGYSHELRELAPITDIREFISRTAKRASNLPTHEMFAKDSFERFRSRQKMNQSCSLEVEGLENLLSGREDGALIFPSDGGDVELIYDLGEQNIGYYSFQLEAQEGIEVDIYSVEYITPDGRIQYPDDNRNGMTYITKAGLNNFTSLKRRSGRYVFIRFCNQTEPIKIHKLNLIESTYPVEYKGAFECSDSLLNQIWNISVHTLKLCMEDTFTDCPLYEQTLWVGDARNESLFAYGVFGAEDLARRCISLAAQSLERFPIVGSQVPSSWQCILPAWSFLWGISVWDYYWHTGDRTFMAEMWPYVMQNLRGASEHLDKNGLFSGDFWNFFDWTGIDQNHKTVLHNSMLMVGAIDAAIRCATILQKKTDSDWLEDLRKKLTSAINRLWQEPRQVYPDSVHEDGTISKSVSQHTSFLSLLFDIAPQDRFDSLMLHITEPSEQSVKVGSPFAMFYLYQTLEKFGCNDLLLKSIADSYGAMLEADATTVWESFPSGALKRGNFPTRSHCHAWSSAPLYFFQRIILGIHQTVPGGDAFEISPHVSSIKWAKGSFSTTKGNLNVSWRKDADRLFISYSGPKGVEIAYKENETHSGFMVVISNVLQMRPIGLPA